MKKIVAVLACLCLFFCAACSASPAGAELYHEGKEVKVDTILTIDGFPVSLDLYRYYFKTLQYQIDGGNDTYWMTNPGAEDTLKTETLTALRAYVTLLRVAEQKGITLDEADRASIAQSKKDAEAEYASHAEYVKAMERLCITDEVYNCLLEQAALRDKLEEVSFKEGGDYYVSDEEFAEIWEAGFLGVKQICVDNQTIAAAAANRLKKDGDIDDLIRRYMGEDASTEPMYFGPGYMVDNYERAVRDTHIGAPGGPIKTNYGYHVFLRVPLDPAYFEEHKAELKQDYMTKSLAAALAEQGLNYTLETAPEYEYVSTQTLV